MIFAYLDEFGHIGPFISRAHPEFNASPVFGLAGILLPEQAIRSFATYFLQRKSELLAHDIERSGKPAYAWEKKGSSLFTANSLEKYPEIRRTAFRLITNLQKSGGHIFYYGREKVRQADGLNSTGFYKTIFSHCLRDIDKFCEARRQNYVVVLDEHSSRKDLLETASKTMFGSEPTRKLASPPFEVESYLNQNIQAADWIAAIIGRIWAYRLEPGQFGAYAPYEKFFHERISLASTHSSILIRSGLRPRPEAGDTP